MNTVLSKLDRHNKSLSRTLHTGMWQGRSVTVTGGAGFLGSAVVSKLNELGAEVFVPRSGEYDLMRAEDTQELYEKACPDLLIHLAARVGGIGANQESPGSFFFANMTMGLNVIEQARLYGRLKKLVFIGTTCSYPKFTDVPFREEDLWKGYPEETNAAYGIAKRSLLAMSWAYRQQYGVNIVYLIPANLYGPGDNFDLKSSHVIPALIRKFIEAKESKAPNVTVWGTGKVSREFLYVHDAALGILLAAQHYEKPAPVNLGTGREIRISEIVEMIRKATGSSSEIVWDSTRPDGQPRRCLDTSRARSEFGFTAATPLETGLAATVAWYRMQAGVGQTHGPRRP